MSVGVLELSLIVLACGILGIAARLLRQPVLLSYMLAGALLSAFHVFDLSTGETWRLFSELGIMFLLFLVGLELNYSSLRLVGRTALIVGLGQIIFTSIIGYFLARGLGLDILPSLYAAVALTFSSTVIVVKLLSEKRDLNSLYGKISVGFLLVQDFAAILILIALAGLGHGGTFSVFSFALVLIKGLLILGATVWVGRSALPRLFEKLSSSPELLFVVSLGWLLVISLALERFGFSLAIGGFLAGLSLSNSSDRYSISSRVRPLRDFFLLLFFVALGASLVNLNLSGLLLPIIVFSLFVLVGNPLIVLILMGALGYRRRTSFEAGLTVAQISEFSLILVALGAQVGHVGDNVVAIVTGVAVVTIALSTYLIAYSAALARRFDQVLRFFERKHLIENNLPEDGYKRGIVLVGAHRTGRALLNHLPQSDTLVIDFDPDVARKLRGEGWSVLLGSISDDDIREASHIAEARLVISTSPDFDENQSLLQYLKHGESEAKVIMRAEDEREVELLYKAGATYCIYPHQSAGQFLGKHIEEHPDLSFLNILRKNSLVALRK